MFLYLLVFRLKKKWTIMKHFKIQLKKILLLLIDLSKKPSSILIQTLWHTAKCTKFLLKKDSIKQMFRYGQTVILTSMVYHFANKLDMGDNRTLLIQKASLTSKKNYVASRQGRLIYCPIRYGNTTDYITLTISMSQPIFFRVKLLNSA